MPCSNSTLFIFSSLEQNIQLLDELSYRAPKETSYTKPGTTANLKSSNNSVEGTFMSINKNLSVSAMISSSPKLLPNVDCSNVYRENAQTYSQNVELKDINGCLKNSKDDTEIGENNDELFFENQKFTNNTKIESLNTRESRSRTTYLQARSKKVLLYKI